MRLVLPTRFDLTSTGNRLTGTRRATLQKPLGILRRHPCRVGRRIEFFLVGQRGGIKDDGARLLLCC